MDTVVLAKYIRDCIQELLENDDKTKANLKLLQNKLDQLIIKAGH